MDSLAPGAAVPPELDAEVVVAAALAVEAVVLELAALGAAALREMRQTPRAFTVS
jgi:hypothetical protein